MVTVLESLNSGLHRAMAEDPRVILLGEDLLDPYGGAFKVTRGLSSAYPERVLSSPISEAALVGLGSGMAMRGLRPVVEIMFGDFLTLAADQLVNHAAKFRWMYNDQLRVPLVVRTPMGGRRGYGPTHSQTLEKIFLGVPGLNVWAPCDLGDPGELLYHLILEGEDPNLFIENKLLYPLRLQEAGGEEDFEVQRLEGSPLDLAPAFRLVVRGAPDPIITLATYGYTATLARQALLQLAYGFEIFADLIIPTKLAPLDCAPYLDSLKATGSLLVIEESSPPAGWGAELIAQAAEAADVRLKSVRRLGARHTPIPASVPLEQASLPSVADIVHLARQMLGGQEKSTSTL
jgi:pyruvate/2-oxoglutarate/acetoin dehydrogenase E1 component